MLKKSLLSNGNALDTSSASSLLQLHSLQLIIRFVHARLLVRHEANDQKSRAFLICPLIFIKNSRSHSARRDMRAVKQEAEGRVQQPGPTCCHCFWWQTPQPSATQKCMHWPRGYFVSLTRLYQSDFHLLISRPRLPVLTSSCSIKWFYWAHSCCFVRSLSLTPRHVTLLYRRNRGARGAC